MEALEYWIYTLSRETSELLLEEKNRGRALTDLLIALEIPNAARWKPLGWHKANLPPSHLLRCIANPAATVAYGYGAGWKNLVLSAVKIIPLGQTQGQKILHEMTLPSLCGGARFASG